MGIEKERELFKEEVSELDSFDLNDFTLNPFDWDEENQKFYFNPTQLMWEVWQAAKAKAVPKINGSIQEHELAISEIKAEIEEGYDLCQDSYLLDVLVERGIDIGKIQAVSEGFVLVPKEPTEAMYIAGADKRQSGGNTADVYKAMIEAQEPAND